MSYSSVILATAGLVNFWRLNETSGTTFADSKGSRTLTIAGGVTLNQASLTDAGEASALFNGSTGLASNTVASDVSNLASSSMEAWFHSTDFTVANQAIIFNGNGNGVGVYISGNGTTNGSLQLLAGGVAWLNTGLFITDNAVHHIVVTFSATKVPKIYLDGLLIYTGTAMTINTATGAYMSTGAFKGYLADGALYNVILSPDTILAHYRAVNPPSSPFVDGHASAAAPGQTTIALTTNLSNNIIVICYFSEKGGGSVHANITGITGGGLTFQKRGQTFKIGNYVDLEIWWALALSPLSATTFTIALDSTIDDGAVVAFGAHDCYTPFPWDMNGTLPKADNVNNPPSATYSTSQSKDLLIGAFGAVSGAAAPSPAPTGYTMIDTAGTSSGSLFGCIGVAGEKVTSPQTSVSVTWNGTSPSNTLMILDALTNDITRPLQRRRHKHKQPIYRR